MSRPPWGTLPCFRHSGHFSWILGRGATCPPPPGANRGNLEPGANRVNKPIDCFLLVPEIESLTPLRSSTRAWQIIYHSPSILLIQWSNKDVMIIVGTNSFVLYLSKAIPSELVGVPLLYRHVPLLYRHVPQLYRHVPLICMVSPQFW